MRIGYYVPATLHRHPGIQRRVDQTLSAWTRQGHTGILISGEGTGQTDLTRHLRGDVASARVAGELISSGRIDHIHARLFLPTPGWPRLDPSVPVSLEIHGSLRRPESVRDVTRVLLGAASSRALVRRTKAAVFVTGDLARRAEYRSIATRLAIGNGIQLGHPVKAPANSRPRVGMAVGTSSAWHGLDRLIQLSRAHPDLDFLVIAPAELKNHIDAVVADSNVRATFSRDAIEYRALLASCDVALGSLALERAGLSEAAPLKVRDYVDAGIPTVLAYVDTNLVGADDPAVLQVPMEQLTDCLSDWARDMRGSRVLETTRRLVSIDTVEERRLRVIADSHGASQ